MSKRRTNAYSLEFKQSSAKLAAESEQSVIKTAKDLGIHETTLYGWIARYHPRNNMKSSNKDTTNEELKLLRRENTRLKHERDILKKAAAYFASEM